MPKTKPLDLEKSKYRDLVVQLSGCLFAEEKSPEELGCKLGDISSSSIRRYLRNPENMRVKDLNRLGRILGADIEALRKNAIRY